MPRTSYAEIATFGLTSCSDVTDVTLTSSQLGIVTLPLITESGYVNSKLKVMLFLQEDKICAFSTASSKVTKDLRRTQHEHVCSYHYNVLNPGIYIQQAYFGSISPKILPNFGHLGGCDPGFSEDVPA